MDEYEDIRRWWDAQSQVLRSNAEIVSAKELGLKDLFRIDKQVQKEYIPRMPLSPLDGEDRTTPRVCMGTDLFGCVLGYGQWDDDTVFGTAKNARKDFGYKGGYYIQAIEFEYAVRINKNLVSEAPYTGEVWLVNYNRKTSSYKSRVIGKLFIKELSLHPVHNRQPDVQLQVFIENQYDGLPIIKGKIVDKGYYSVQATYESPPGIYGARIAMPGKKTNHFDESLYEITSIDKQKYTDAKNYTAQLLSLPNNVITEL